MTREPQRASRPADLDICAVVRRAQCQAQVLEDLAVQAQGLALAAGHAAGSDTGQQAALTALAAEAQAVALCMARAARESRSRMRGVLDGAGQAEASVSSYRDGLARLGASLAALSGLLSRAGA